MKAKLGKVRTCPHCRAFIRLVSIRGAIVWAHTPGQGTRCNVARAKREAAAAAKAVTP